MESKTVISLVAAWMLLSFSAIAQAVNVPVSTMVGPVPAVPGTGLGGSYWLNPGFNTSLAGVDAFISSTPKMATFASTYIDYPNGALPVTTDPQSDWTMTLFLGRDGSTLSGYGSTRADFGNILLFEGYIAITSDLDVTPGGLIDVNFALGSDDGSRLRIGGVPIVVRDGTIPFGVTSGTASFSSAGLYPIEVVWYNSWGASGVELSSSIPSDNLGSGDVGIVPPSYLYAEAPEPGSITLLVAGALGFVGRGRSRRRS